MKTRKFIIALVVMIIGISLATVAGRYLYNLFTYTSVFPAGIPSERDIESYGREKFVKQALEYKTTRIVNNEISHTFKPKRADNYNNGVLLVFAENKKYMKGLYVAPEEFFENTTGSGVAIIYRSKHIAIAEIKKRDIGYSDLKGLGVATGNYSNDNKENGSFVLEPNQP